MKLTQKQREVVEANMGLVGKVIKDKVRHVNDLGIYTYDDIYQIGCIGLCKAAATDKGGCFSTYAYRLIWNEICDALIYAARRGEKEVLTYDSCQIEPKEYDQDQTVGAEIGDILSRAKAQASPTTRKGIMAIEMRVQGYSCSEIGAYLHAPVNHVTAWMSKARKYLRAIPELRAAYENGGSL